MKSLLLIGLFFGVSAHHLLAADPPWATTGQDWLDAYFERETKRLADETLKNPIDGKDWIEDRARKVDQLKEMLGLLPEPERTPLNAEITGTAESEGIVVENIHFQSRPGLYVTGNLYRPKEVKERLPAILYVCGHGRVKKDGVSYGNKTYYQHHGAWFARHGYVCLTIDTIQLGELEGHHHGTHHLNMWWWNSRGYTPAGVEAWNSIRALDYLQSRPEVDGERLGVTGRSGGGAYSWWTAALDERVKAAVPVAGITDLENYVVDGCVEGHCDCMFMVNTYQWDYAMVASLVAPRPLLIANTDKDRIFPLGGVGRVHEKVKRVYDALGATENLGLLITEGPHSDTQQLRVPAFHWFNRHLKGEEPTITVAAEKLFQPEELKVFEELPAKERTTSIHDSFVAKAGKPRLPKNEAEWEAMTKNWRKLLSEQVFGGWPKNANNSDMKMFGYSSDENMKLEVFDLETQDSVKLRLYKITPSKRKQNERVMLKVLDQEQWKQWMRLLNDPRSVALLLEYPLSANDQGDTGNGLLDDLDGTLYLFAPRGVGLTELVGSKKKRIQTRRRYQLLGQTMDGMRVWDIVMAARAVERKEKARVVLSAAGEMASNATIASLYIDGLAELQVEGLPTDIQDGPDYLNILRFMNMPEIISMASERHAFVMKDGDKEDWRYALKVGRRMGWGTAIRFEE